MAEEMVITVSIATAQAIENCVALANHIRALKGDIDGLAGSVNTVDGKLATLGATTQQATAPTASLGGAVHNTQQNFTQFNQQLNYAETNVSNYTNITRTAATATTEAGGAMDGLIGQVAALSTAYLGFQTVIQLFDNMLDRLEKIRQAQEKLGGARLQDDKDVVRRLMLNLTPGDDGPLAEQHARKMIAALTDSAAVTRQQASEAMIVSASTGQDPGTAKGMDFAKNLALFMARRNVSGDTAMQLSKLTQDFGMNTPEGLNQFVAQIDQAFKVSHSTNHQAFLTGMISALIPAQQQGMKPEEAMSVFSGLLNVTGSEQQAGDAFKQILALASPGASQKATDFVARHAAQAGLIHPDQIADSQLHLGDGKNLELRKKREQIEKEEREIDLLSDKHGRKPLTPQQRAQQDEHLRDMREKLEHDKESLKVEMDTLRLRQAAESLTKPERFHVVEEAFKAAKTDEEKNRVVAELGGLFRRTDNAFRLASPVAQQKIAEAQAAIGGATAAQTEEGNIGFAKTATGESNASQARAGKIAGDLSAGQMRAKFVMDEAIAKTGLKTADGAFAPSPDDDVSTWWSKWSSFTESQQLAPAAWDILGKQIQAFSDGDANISPEMASAAGHLQSEFNKERSSKKNISGASALQAINNLAQELGNLQSGAAARAKLKRDAQARVAKVRPKGYDYTSLSNEQLDEAEQAENALHAADPGMGQPTLDLGAISAERKRRAAAPKPAGPPAPTTQPESHAVNYHVTNHVVNVGNHGSGGDDDNWDFAGRHENVG